MGENIPNHYKIYQSTIKIPKYYKNTKMPKDMQTISIPFPWALAPKNKHIGILGMQIYHLATRYLGIIR
jgi:hypothetical protein